jgi:hypothetical protein
LPKLPDFGEEVELPWPRSGDEVFASANDRWMNANVNWGGGWGLYAIGYKEAGDLLVEDVAENRGMADGLVYPIVFSYRQYLELTLKDVLMEARRYYEIDKPFKNEHSLLLPWCPLRELLERRWPERPDELEAVEENLRQFDAVDSGSFAFRYARTKAGTPSLREDMRQINLRNLSEVVARIGTFLESCATALSAEREAAE